MSDVNKLSARVIEYAERASAMADAAQGKKRIRSSGLGRMLLPMAGAGLYALAKNKSLSRQAKTAVNGAKSRALELPDELLRVVRQQTRTTPSQTSRNGTASRTTQRRRTRAARSKTSTTANK